MSDLMDEIAHLEVKLDKRDDDIAGLKDELDRLRAENEILLKALVDLYYEDDVAGEKAWALIEKRWEIVKRLRPDPPKETEG